MRTKTIAILAILALSLMLRADSCTVEQRDVSVVLGGQIPMEFSSVGYVDASGTDEGTFDFGIEILDAIEALELDGTPDTVIVTGGGFRVTRSDGHDARRSGSLNLDVTYTGGTPAAPADADFDLLDYNTPTNVAGTEGFAVSNSQPVSPADAFVLFSPAGLQAVNEYLDDFLDAYNTGGSPSLSVTGTVTWDSDPAPSQADPDDFTWEVFLQIQLRQTTETDVFNF